jgi:hypothetical protein
MRNEGLQKTLIAGAAIRKNRVVKFSGTTAVTAIESTAAADFHIGVADNLGAEGVGDRFDVIVDGIALVLYGGSVTQGALLTSDNEGRAVVAAPAAGATVRIIGVAMEGGASGDIGSVLLRHGTVSNAA